MIAFIFSAKKAGRYRIVGTPSFGTMKVVMRFFKDHGWKCEELDSLSTYRSVCRGERFKTREVSIYAIPCVICRY